MCFTKLKDGRYRWTSTATAWNGAKRMYGASRLCKQEALAAWMTTHENTLEVQRLRLIVAHSKRSNKSRSSVELVEESGATVDMTDKDGWEGTR